MRDSTRFKKYLHYVHNTGGIANLAHFVEDWGPDGPALWSDMLDMGLVYADAKGHIRVTNAGVATIRAARP